MVLLRQDQSQTAGGGRGDKASPHISDEPRRNMPLLWQGQTVEKGNTAVWRIVVEMAYNSVDRPIWSALEMNNEDLVPGSRGCVQSRRPARLQQWRQRNESFPKRPNNVSGSRIQTHSQLIGDLGSSQVSDDFWASTSAHNGIRHWISARALELLPNFEIHLEVVHSNAVISTTPTNTERSGLKFKARPTVAQEYKSSTPSCAYNIRRV